METAQEQQLDSRHAMTPAEVAARWNCTTAFICKECRLKRLKAFKLGTDWRIFPEWVKEYEEKKKHG